jgi:hypothetical protein
LPFKKSHVTLSVTKYPEKPAGKKNTAPITIPEHPGIFLEKTVPGKPDTDEKISL